MERPLTRDDLARAERIVMGNAVPGTETVDTMLDDTGETVSTATPRRRYSPPGTP